MINNSQFNFRELPLNCINTEIKEYNNFVNADVRRQQEFQNLVGDLHTIMNDLVTTDESSESLNHRLKVAAVNSFSYRTAFSNN